MLPLILASSSPFRRQILDKLQLNYRSVSPDIDETIQHNESATMLVARLAEAKALKVADTEVNSLIIGSDQVAVLGDQILGKPLTHANATEQLTKLSGKKVTFYTGLTLLNSLSGKNQTEVVPFNVVFRNLNQQMIERYLLTEKPYNCAGSFKSEALGIALFERLEGDDPNTLMGLPLIRLIRMLENEGIRAV